MADLTTSTPVDNFMQAATAAVMRAVMVVSNVVTVADDTARFALTSAAAPNTSIVKVTATGNFYLVVDDTSLNDADGYSIINPSGSVQLVLRQGTTAELASITPVEGEPVWDTTLNRLSVGDGSTAGGVAINGPQTTLYDIEDPTIEVIKTYSSFGSSFGLQLPDNSTGIFAADQGILMYAPTDAVSFIHSTGLVQIPLLAGNTRVVANPTYNDNYLVAIFNKTNTTLTDIGILVGTELPIGNYDFEAVLHVTADVVGGHKYDISGTAVISNIICTLKSLDLGTNAFVIADRITAFGSSVGQAGATSVETTIKGIVQVTTAGTFFVRFAQNAANGTSSVLAGSTIKIRKLA